MNVAKGPAIPVPKKKIQKPRSGMLGAREVDMFVVVDLRFLGGFFQAIMNVRTHPRE